ncbi:Na+/H+ antiporter subunit E [Oceanobacillus halophilus]|uniref:Na+/H+ antiporter subunit E n=1 Tax=Oceanobacillus halophilus TaxID=930130 RepID=A0A495AE72_9BACI|nr:Na+/H+ antiporter subunit E [Oceanobacillus halophilus]RKQ37860.1 Na+/H+ antiporter subunit E [Oceanobacillus halophilus]
MAFQIIINLIIAVLWMFLSESYAIPSFITGFIFGILLLFLMRRFISGEFYFIKVVNIFKLIFIFIKEVIISNIDMLKYIYSPKKTAEPGIFELPLDVKSNWEISILAGLISLTPGTLSVAVSDDNQSLFIHAMNIDDVNKSITEIKTTFERMIMEVTR